jgi:hypothetical protein
MKDLRVMTGPFDLLGLGGYSADELGEGGINHIDLLLEVSMLSD